MTTGATICEAASLLVQRRALVTIATIARA
ncbi:hypothetical protein [Sphingobacterium bovistauri]|uniref:Uncharacterized protein n=1 Tax=Sphingobacterium bovistauri TaxID=2781959 RepID=A0ABS7Z577_9SPHI|nr:hypothetical protein [Sphingobacterium bovistauri]